jgi:hypothetical protein
MSDSKNGSKAAAKAPALIVFGRIKGSNIDQAAMFLEKDVEAAKKAATEAGLSFIEVKSDEQRKTAAALPEGVVNTQGRFSLSPASRETIDQLGQLLKAATEGEAASAVSDDAESSSPGVSPRLWRELKPGALVLAAGFDEEDNITGWWEAIIVKIDGDEFLVRWRDAPDEPRASRSRHYIALLHPGLSEL